MDRKRLLKTTLSLLLAFTMTFAPLFSSYSAIAFAAGTDQETTGGTEVSTEEPAAETPADEAVPGEEAAYTDPVQGSGEETLEPSEQEEPEAEEVSEAEVPEDVPDDANTDNSDSAPAAEEPDKAEAEPEENPEETTAGYSERRGVEAAEVAGEAAESKTEAKEALREETDIPSKRVNSVVKELFDESKAANEDEGDESSDENTPPRSGDGSNIENISAKWITPDTVDNEDAALLYVKPAKNEDQSVRLQINYALSGEHSYDPGDIVITVPAYIFKDRNGKDYGNMIIPYPEDPSKKGDFNWRFVGDHYEITNTKRMSAATKGFIQFQIEGMKPDMLVDMETSAPFDALIEVTTHKGNLIALRSNELTAQFDTEAKLTNVNKRNRTVTRVKASQIPENQRIEGEDEYIKVDWYVWGTTLANTYYTIDQTDLIPQSSVVSSRNVVADEDVKNVSKEISLTEAKAIDPSYGIGDTVALKESDVRGFVIGGESSDATSVTKNNIYHGSSDGNGQYYSFSTAYPASQFQKDVEYTFHNNIRYKVTEDDPEVKENTNPNVQKEDPKLVTTKTDKAQVTWSYRDPEWIDPTGHFMVTKNGNDDTDGKNITHRSTYTTDDLHIHYRAPYGSIHGWYGIYPSALNELQDAYEENGEKGSVRLSYTIDTVGYALPWMYDGGVKEFHEGELPARIIGNYNRPVTITTKDTGISIGRNGDKLKVLKDYAFEEIEFPESPYVYTGKPQNIEPDGSWTALDHGDGTFKYSRDNDKSNWPDITLQIQRDGKWEDYAVASWKSGSRVVTLTSGGTAGNGIVKVPSDTQNFRTIVNLKNTEGGEGATEAIQAAVDYDVRVVVNLNSTKDMIALIEKAFSKSNTPSMEVYNSANMLVERSDEPENSQEREIVSIERDGYDSIRGYTTDTAVYPYKSSTQKLKEVDYEARTILIHYTAKVEERSVISDKKTWEQAVADKRLDADTSCVWRDLLPRGVTPLLDTVTLRKGDTKTKQPYTIENYMGTHRTLLVVEAELEPTPQTYRAGDMYYYEDVPTISFDAIYDFESLIDYGYELHNVIAYESGNKQLGTIKDYSGEPDDPTLAKHKNTATEQAFNNKDPKEKATEKKAMTNLDTDQEHDGYENFVYAGAWTKIDILSAARTSLYKDVQVNNDGIWSEGTYYKDIYGDPPKEATEGGRMRTVYEGGQYTYRLRVMSDPSTISTDLIIYDSLENFYATGSTAEADNDPIDYIEPGDKGTENDPHWQGVLRGIDTSQLEKMGCAPVIYYSTIEELQLSDESDPDKANATNVKLGNREVWIPASEYKGSLEDVKAIAVDCSNASEEADEAHYRIDPETGARKFMLPEMESIVVNVNMQAPSGDEAREYIAKSGKWGDSGQAYNNAYLLCTSIDKDNPDDFDPDNFVRKDYTKVGLKEYSIKATKKWNDDDNRDGKRPDKVTFRLFADGVEVKDSRVSPKVMDVAAGETEVTFDHIPYTQPDGTKIIYTVVEDPVALYTSDQSVKDTTYQFTNIHTPERTRVSGEKTWEGDEEENRPASIDIELYANGKKLKTQTVKPDANGNWKYDFTNLFKYEDGKEIKYTIKEVKTPDTGNKLDSYIPSYDGNDILNTYHPYGDLKVNKTINGATEVSREKEFDFTFTFSRKPQSGSEEAQPVFDEYEYEILDGDGNAVTGDDDEPLIGTVKTNDTVSIKGGQTIHVKEIPQGISYDVTEAEASGFKITGKSGDSGTIKPNQTAEASFTNTYSASGRINLEAKKVLENRIVNKNQFSFELYEVTEDEDGGEIEEIKANGYNAAAEETITRENGTIDKTIAPVTFGVIRYSQADHGKTFKYRMKEVIKDRAGYTYSKEIYEVNVTVTDKGDGSLEITPVYTDSEGNPITDIEGEPTETPYFTNEYKAAGKTTLLAWKSLPGRDLKDDEFTFELLDENGDPVMNSPESSSDETGDGTGDSEAGDADQGGNAEAGTPVTATSKANATVTFSPEEVQALNYTEKDIGKTYYYAIREKAGTDDAVIYDEHVYGYAVKIFDNDDGTLSIEQTLATPVFDTEDPSKIVSWTTEGAVLPVFNNTLKDGGFSVKKTVVDSPDADSSQEFKFKVVLIGEEIKDEAIEYKIDADDTGSGSDSGYSDDPEIPDEPGDGQQGEPDSEQYGSSGDEVVYSGKSSGMDWKITKAGALIFGKAGETQTYSDTYPSSGMLPQPWSGYRNMVKSLRFDGPVKAVGNINGLFHGMPNLVSVDLEGFDISRVTQLWALFEGDKSLEELDLSGMFSTVSSVNRCPSLVAGCSSLKTLDISTLRLTTNANLNSMFNGCSVLSTIKIGPQFRFRGQDSVQFPAPPTSTTTGKWIKEDGTGSAYTPAQLASAYNSGMAGTWIWEPLPSYTIKFEAESGAGGSMKQERVVVNSAFDIPANRFFKKGYRFKQWNDGNGNTYTNKDNIPKNKYGADEVVTLTAEFEPASSSVELVNGEFEFTLLDGEIATFDNIPAGTTYQVYEETPNGWLLVSSDNVAGTIEPLVTSEVHFANKYEPWTASAQFFGTKTLDQRSAKAGSFKFILKEGDKEIEKVSVLDGGFIRFSPIVYDTPGTHTYTIEEEVPEQDTVDWDTHKETVTVKVTENGADLVADVTYDSDGVRFTNKTRPGILRLTKSAKVTEANKDDEFTFRITLNNADGMPLGSDSQIYWYTEKASADNADDSSNAGKQSLRSKVKTLLKTGKTKQSSAIEGSNIASGQTDGKTLSAAQNPVLKAGGTRAAGSEAAQNFEYTGSPQTFTAPSSGYYKFEAWGASGADVSGTHRINKNDYTGGRGGYAGGKIYLTAGTTIYVYVGGKGNNSTHVSPSASYGWRANGGWNGGGTSNSDIATDASGGGATDFRLTNGAWNNFDSLKSRIMVAGGGGGAGKWDGNYNGQGIEGGNGGAGGGINGINGTTEPALKGGARAIAKGGTQTAGGNDGGLFGQGAVEYYGGGSGGGGYFGGGMQSRLHRGGGGGSGFVSGLTNCNAIREDSTSSNIRMSGQPKHYSGRVFTDAQLIAGNQSFTSPDGLTETGHTGNGYARITMLSTEITYDPNGASGDPVTKSYDVADGILLPHPDVLDMEYADHVFIGWAKNKDAELPDYEAGEILDISEGVPSTLYAVWMSKDEYLINLDANGGYVTPQLVRAADIYTPVTLPEPTKPGTDVFAGWNTEADGSGTMFYDTVIGEQIPAQPGEKVTLYAQWADGVTKAKYKVRHFKQNASGSGYSLYETENLIGNRGDIVSPAEKEYEGYVCVRKDPDAETYTLPEQGEPDLVVDFYYDLCTFEVVYDGNGATSGQMNDPQEMKGGVQYNLLENRYSRKGYLFTGWNTEADGSGRTYVDKQKVKNLSRTNGDTVTLYAQWHSNEEHVLEPTNGEIIVKCKAGEIIVIPDLPAGTTYTIEEIDLPAGWTQTGSVGTDGSIIANGVSDATVTNAYKAEGDAIINAHKTLEGAAIEEGQFTFELFTKDDKDNETIIETVTNGAVDANAEVDDADGNLVDNPYYGTSIVQFTPFTYSQADIGKTYTYYVREKGSVDGITLDEHVYSAEVKVEDAGGGNLTAAVTWTDTQGGLEPVFKNKMKPAELNISKSVISDASAIPETEFTFTVDLLDENGEPVEGTFETKTGSKTGSVQSGGTVKLKGGETVTISGLPHGVTYKVTEAEVQNWEQTSAEGTEGMLEPGKSYEASFENKYTPPEKKPYTAEGSVVLKAKKTVTGGTISEEDDFTFELLDEEGNSLQSKGCDTVSTEDNKVTQSDITFNAIRYTLDDLPYPEDEVEARVEELLKPYQAAYDAAKADYEGQDPKPAKAFMSFEEYIRKNYEGKTLNKLLDELTEQAESEAVREKTFTYLVREINGGDADVHYDSHTYYYKVRAWDNGQGRIETEVTKWKPGAEGEEDAQVNDIEFINSRSTQIKVYKRWSDHGNQDGYRPDKDDFAGMIHLMNGDTEVTDVTPKIIEEEDGNLAIVYEDLPVFDDQGNEITYSVKEDGIDHYTAKDGKDTAEDGETITNVHEPETMKLTVNKVWDDYDDKYGKRAGAVLTLYKTVGGAESAAALPVPVGTTDDWSFTWENLPVKEEGKVITYSVKELLPDGTIYESSVSDPVVAEDGAEGTVTVTNTCNDKTEATVRKIWDDNNNKAGKRPETLTVKLLRKVGAGEATQAVDENGDAITVTLPVNGKWEATVSDLPKYDPDANTISYSWQEVQEGMPEGYVLSGTSVSGTATTLTNKFNPPKSGDILIRKVDKDGKSISGAVFEVYRLDGDSRSKLSHDKYSWLNSEDQFTVGRKPFSITGLEDGTYEIYEVKAPEGYRIDIKYPVIFTIWNGELLPELNVISDNVRYELLEDGKYQFSIMNSGSPGVKTGDNSHLILYAGTMLTAVLLMLILVVRRRKRSE